MSGDARHDVVVIGAGAGGAAVAWGLCRRGLSVLLLDAGPRFDSATDYPLTEADWDLHDFPEKPGSKSEAVLAPAQTFEMDEPLLEAKSRGAGHDPHPRRGRCMAMTTFAASAARRFTLPAKRTACIRTQCG